MPNEDYLLAGVHIGMKQKTKSMEKFIYKVRPDGLNVLNVQEIDRRIRIAAKFLSQFKKIMVASRKINGKKPVEMFAKITGSKAVTGRFLPGTITNPSFRNYYEPDVVIITDPVTDVQPLQEAVKMRKPVIALCDTFNETRGVDFVIPCNNKGRKAIAMVYLILARELLKARGEIKSDKEFKYKLEDFESKAVPPRKARPTRRMPRRR